MRPTELAAGVVLILVIASGLALDPVEAPSGPRIGRLTANLIQSSRPDIPQVDIQAEAIPTGMTERGTSFPLGNDLWFSARHVVNADCAHVILVNGGKNFYAGIKSLDQNADLALLQVHVPAAVPMPVAALGLDEDPPEHAYAFGYPQGVLGATSDEFLGRTRLRLGGHLAGTSPVLAWTEVDRYPNDLDTLAGISGGPMVSENGYVVGDIVAASVRRGRNYTVAPEILADDAGEGTGVNSPRDAKPIPEIVKSPVSLADAAKAMEQSARIVQTYCIP
jgi:S1-C subfamily serine protease